MGYLEDSGSSQKQFEEQGTYLGHMSMKEKGSLQVLGKRPQGHHEPRLVIVSRSLFSTGSEERKYALVAKPGMRIQALQTLIRAQSALFYFHFICLCLNKIG